jgi:hypothetical protein
MATRCNIAIFEKQNEQGVHEVKIIYSHFDGYPSGVGATLMEHYTDINKIRKLIDGGDISTLRKEVDIPDGAEHSFDNRAENITVFYGRDRGETDVDAVVKYIISKDSLKNLKNNEYLYVYLVEEEKWITL